MDGDWIPWVHALDLTSFCCSAGEAMKKGFVGSDGNPILNLINSMIWLQTMEVEVEVFLLYKVAKWNLTCNGMEDEGGLFNLAISVGSLMFMLCYVMLCYVPNSLNRAFFKETAVLFVAASELTTLA